MPFGFDLGLSANYNNSNTSFTGTDNYNKNFTQTSTPTNPDWVSQGGQDIFTGAQNLAGRNPLSYVAGPTPLQGTAYTNSMGLQNGDGLFDAGSHELGYIMNANAPQVGSAATASPYISQYMDPALNDVVNATTADLNANDAQTRAAQSLALARSGAFGGSGAAITQGQTEGQLERARATTLGNLRMGAFSQALNAANADAQRSESAKELNANLRGQQMDRAAGIAATALPGLATAYDANARANIENQAGVGGQVQAINQRQAQAPLDLQSWLGSQFSNIPLNLYHGETDNGTENGTDTKTGKSTTSSFGFGGKVGF